MVQLGNYDECLELEDIATEYGSFSGQHCLVSIGERNVFTEMTAKDRMEYTFDQIKFPNNYENNQEYKPDKRAPFMGAMWSVCIPSSCRPSDLQLHLQATLSHVLGNASIRVHELACNSRADPSSPFTTVDYLAIILISAIVFSVVISTFYDLRTSSASQRSNLFLSFSLVSNGKRLFDVTPKSDQLPVLDGVRTLSMFWVVIVHTYIIALYSPMINMNHVEQYASDWLHLFISNGSLSVDLFLMLSGTLVCYNFMNDRDKGKKFNLMRYYLLRYIRLTPVYVLLIFIQPVLSKRLSGGPYAKASCALGMESCSTSGWLGPLYLSTYVDPNSVCISHAWSLCVDMHLFWLSPLILIPLWRKPKLGKTLLGLLVLGGLAVSFMTSSLLYLQVGNLSHHYITTHTRFTPWLIGVTLGLLLHSTKDIAVKLPSLVVVLGWLSSVALSLGTLLLGHEYLQPDYQYDDMSVALYTALSRSAFSLGIVWCIFACSRGYGGFVNPILSWTPFRILSAVSYSTYMLHFIILLGLLVNGRSEQHYNDISMIVKALGVLVISLILAAAMYLIVEQPAINLGKVMIDNTRALREEFVETKEKNTSNYSDLSNVHKKLLPMIKKNT